jgi:hypothetical protein
LSARVAVHAHQIAVENAVLDHRALDPQHVVRHPGEDRWIEQQAAMDFGIGPDRRTGRHPAEHRDIQQFGARRCPSRRMPRA